MSDVRLTTFSDLVDHLLDYAGGDAQKGTLAACKRAAQGAYRAFFADFRWSYLYARGRINISAPYSTGTITYTHSTRTVTLASGTWPSWAAYGELLIDDVHYAVAERTSDSVIVLSQASNPGENVAAGTSYTIFRDTYPLPADCQALGHMIDMSSGFNCVGVAPNDWLVSAQQVRRGSGPPTHFCVVSDPNYIGSLAARVAPYPDNDYAYDFIYHRRPRQIVTLDYSTGTLTTTADSTTVTGTSTAFTSAMLGSVIRISANSVDVPNGLEGANPYLYERIVTAVGSATSLTVDQAIPESLSAVKYRISDPVDIEDGAMLTAFLRECEAQARLVLRMKQTDVYGEQNERLRAYIAAREADNRLFGLKVAGGVQNYRRRLSDMPAGEDA